MKKIVSLTLIVTLVITLLTGCGNKQKTFDGSNTVGVISREDGSGTRGAFIELFGIETTNEDGEPYDNTTQKAVITNNTAVMMTTVSSDLYAIGYISLGSMNDTVRAVKIDGAKATAENIKNGTYKVARPFNIVTTDDLSEEAEDFIDFILSADGQALVEEAGYIGVSETPKYSGSVSSGKIVIAGSSSVTPVMEKLKEAYLKLNPNIKIEVQQSDSSTGVENTISGACDIGMASRELKASEIKKGAKPTVIAMDGIAIIVNNASEVVELSNEQVKTIFTGEAEYWSDVLLGGKDE